MFWRGLQERFWNHWTRHHVTSSDATLHFALWIAVYTEEAKVKKTTYNAWDFEIHTKWPSFLDCKRSLLREMVIILKSSRQAWTQPLMTAINAKNSYKCWSLKCPADSKKIYVGRKKIPRRWRIEKENTNNRRFFLARHNFRSKPDKITQVKVKLLLSYCRLITSQELVMTA